MSQPRDEYGRYVKREDSGIKAAKVTAGVVGVLLLAGVLLCFGCCGLPALVGSTVSTPTPSATP